MSTDPQKLSIPLQKAANERYALDHGFEIVATYEDPGASGLTIDKRPGLQRLLSDVVSGASGFQAILVFDVSRWGRFQDPDEGAHYEFLCRSAGLAIHYTTEIFANDESLPSTLVKHIKRLMAAEFSRDLSEKIRRVHTHLHSQGFFTGGAVPYAFQRFQVGPRGGVSGPLGPGEKKSYLNSRIILAPGPPDEVALVRRVFKAFVRRQRSTAQIVRELNAAPATLRRGKPWTTDLVRTVLSNELYSGTTVLGKEIYHLNRRIRQTPRSAWRRLPKAVPAIVSAATWTRAQSYLSAGRSRLVSELVLLADLRALQLRHGHLSAEIIAQGRGYPVGAYRRVFGNLTTAYVRAGFGRSTREARARLRAARPIESYRRRPGRSDETLINDLRALYQREGRLSSGIIDHASDCVNVVVYRLRFGGLRRAYALAGYEPSGFQDLQMETRGQPYSRGDAAEVCRLVRAAAPGEVIWRADAEALARGSNMSLA